MIHTVYWDSDAFLRVINGEEDRAFNTDRENATKILTGGQDVWSQAQKGVIHIVTSTLTVAEVIHKNGTPKLDPKHRDEINNFFFSSFISLKPLTREIAELARDVVWDNDIKGRDAVHVATCAYFKIKELHSIDLSSKDTITINGFSIKALVPSPKQREIINERAS